MKKLFLTIILFSLFGFLFSTLHFSAYANGTPDLTVSPSTNTTQGGNFLLNVTVSNVTDMVGWAVSLKFRKIVEVVEVVKETSFFDGTFFDYNYENDTFNYYKVDIFSATLGSEVSGSGVVAKINFTATYNGTANLQITSTEILDISEENVTHTRSCCTIMVLGSPSQTYLKINPVSNGALNITEGTHIYDNTSTVKVYATQTTATFKYFTLDGVQNSSNPISIPMTSDHELSATFQIPIVTITTEPSATIKINNIPYQASELGGLTKSLSLGTYQLEISKAWYYKYKAPHTITGDTSLNIPLGQMLFSRDIPQTSEMATMQASIPYSNISTSGYYLDIDKLVYAEPSFNKTGTITLTIHHNTNYPIIEIETQDIGKINIAIVQLYETYYASSYENMIGATRFTGLKVDSNIDLTIQIAMPTPSDFWKKPTKILKNLPNQTAYTEFNDWYVSDNVLFLTVKSGDPSFSLLFPEPTQHGVVTIYKVLLPTLVLVGFGIAMIKAKPKTLHETVTYLVLFGMIGFMVIALSVTYIAEAQDVTATTFTTYLGTGSKLAFQNDLDKFVTLQVTSGTLNSSDSQLQMNTGGGTYSFKSNQNLNLKITYTVPSVRVAIGASKDAFGVKSGDVISASNNERVTIYWDIIFEPLWPIMFILGMVGLGAMFGGPLYAVYLGKHHRYRDGLVAAVLWSVIGWSFFIAWVFG